MWDVIWRDTDKTVEQRITGGTVEQRTTWTNPDAIGYQPDPVTNIIRNEA